MPELKQVASVHCQLELMGLTQEEDLAEPTETGALRSRRARHLEHPQPGSAYLKVPPRGEGEEGQLPLLLPPAAAQVGVPDEQA